MHSSSIALAADWPLRASSPIGNGNDENRTSAYHQLVSSPLSFNDSSNDTVVTIACLSYISRSGPVPTTQLRATPGCARGECHVRTVASLLHYRPNRPKRRQPGTARASRAALGPKQVAKDTGVAQVAHG